MADRTVLSVPFQRPVCPATTTISPFCWPNSKKRWATSRRNSKTEAIDPIDETAAATAGNDATGTTDGTDATVTSVAVDVVVTTDETDGIEAAVATGVTDAVGRSTRRA